MSMTAGTQTDLTRSCRRQKTKIMAYCSALWHIAKVPVAANQASGAPRSGACCGRADGHKGPRAVGIAGSYVERSPGRLWPALVPVGVHAPATLYEKRSELQICLASGCGSLSGANQSTNQEAVKSGRSLRTGPHLFRSAGDCDRLLSDLKATYNGTSLATVTLINCAPPPHASCHHCTHDQS